MMTPQEVSEKTFVKAVFGGYDMETVDEFLEPLTEDYIALYKENAVLKSKIKVLVESVEEYRKLEDTARKTLFTAQKTADDLMAETERKCAQMMTNAEAVARSKVEALKDEIAAEEDRLNKARRATTTYLDKVGELSRNQMAFAEEMLSQDIHKTAKPERFAAPAAPAAAAPQAETEVLANADSGDVAKQIESQISALLNGTGAEAEDMEQTRPIPSIFNDDSATRAARFESVEDADEPVSEDDDDYEADPKPKYEFIDLKFGSDYDPNQ